MSVQVLEFWLPMPPKVANSNKAHWAMITRENTKFFDELNRRAQIGYHVPPVPATPIDPAWLDATFYRTSRRYFMDRDNRKIRLKRVIDWLVRSRYLVDDKDENLFYNDPDQAVFDKLHPAPDLCSLHLTLRPWNGTKTG